MQVKIPTQCEAISMLRPVQLVGGEQTLFAVTAEGKVHATGYGAGGRLGVGGTDSVCTPSLLESVQHIYIKKVICLIICDFIHHTGSFRKVKTIENIE